MTTLSKVISLLVCVSLFPKAQAATFKFGARTITVPDGFEVELIAETPLVDRPISADFDDQGRLYVTDSSGSNEKPDIQLQKKPHRIVRLESTAGDGKFDKSIVFADKMMFPEGAMWREGSLYVAAPPSIWKLTDSNDDGIADQREEWMLGKTLTGCANDLHGPYAGPDGWIYWCKGAFAQQTYERPGKDPFVTRAAHIFRSRPDGSGMEPVMTGGMDNPVGIAFTETGERICCSTFLQNPGGGKRDGLIHAVYGGVYGKVNDVVDDHPQTGDLLPVLTHLGPAAPCCVIRYDTTVFGWDYENNLFTCCFNLHKVLRQVLVPEGASFKTVDSDFITSDDTDFHPTAVLEDADGSLIVLDTGGWYKLCCPTSQLAKPDVLGVIYRVRKTGVPKIEDPRGVNIAWSEKSADDLAKLLGDKRPFVRKRAIRQLARQGDAAVAALTTSLHSSDSPESRRNAIWALTRIDSAEARRSVRGALDDKDNTVRHVAAQSVSLWRDGEAESQLLTLLEDKDDQLRRIAAEALGRIGNSEAVPYLLNAVANIGDGGRMLEHSLIFALMEIADPKATAEGLANDNPHVHRAALIALDQMPKNHLAVNTITPLLLSPDPILRETANWIATRHADWGSGLAGFFKERLAMATLPAQETTDLQNQFASMSSDASIQALIGDTLADASAPQGSRLVALRVTAQADVEPAPDSWVRGTVTALQSSNPEVLRTAATTARRLQLPKTGSPELFQALLKIGESTATDSDIRLEALVSAGKLENVSTTLFNFLSDNVNPGKPWAVRNNAAIVLSKSKLDRTQLLQLADTLRIAGPMELGKLITPFAVADEEAVGMKLVENLKTAKAHSSLRVEALQPIISKYPESVQHEAAGLFAMLNADAGKQKEHLDQLLAELPKGDIRHGQAIFNNPKAACSTCHEIGYLGGHVGPDLTAVGTVRTERDLLESIVYPSASFVRSFEPMVVLTKDGEQYNGIVRKDTAEEVVLVTGAQTEAHVPRSDIQEMHQGTVSVMPQGLADQLSKQELADLLAFLKNTKWGPQ